MSLYWHLALRPDDTLGCVALRRGLTAMAMRIYPVVDRRQVPQFVVVTSDLVVDGIGAGEPTEMTGIAIPCEYCPSTLWPVWGQPLLPGRTFPSTRTFHEGISSD